MSKNYQTVKLKDGTVYYNVIEVEEENGICVLKSGYNKIQKEIKVFSQSIEEISNQEYYFTQEIYILTKMNIHSFTYSEAFSKIIELMELKIKMLNNDGYSTIDVMELNGVIEKFKHFLYLE